MALPLVCTLLWKLGFGSPGSVRSRTEVRRPFCLEEVGGWEESKRDQGRGWAVQKSKVPIRGSSDREWGVSPTGCQPVPCPFPAAEPAIGGQGCKGPTLSALGKPPKGLPSFRTPFWTHRGHCKQSPAAQPLPSPPCRDPKNSPLINPLTLISSQSLLPGNPACDKLGPGSGFFPFWED